MNKLVTAAFGIAALLAAPLQAQETSSPAPAGSMAPGGAGAAAPAAAGAPAVSHLVYQFGYNTPAASSGTGTGTVTIDITGPAKDGGMMVTATDNWWNTVNPRQSFTCEVYSDGGVTCPKPPYSISAIQIAVVPLLAPSVLAPLDSSPSSSWKPSYKVRATFFPSSAGVGGFTGQVYTWNCAYTMTGKGVIPNGAPLILAHMDGSMKQQGGRYIIANQKANIAYDPRIKVPALVDEAITFVPRLTVNQYTIQLKLIST